MELAGFDDKKLTVMPVPVPEVTYSDVKIDLRWVLHFNAFQFIEFRNNPKHSNKA